MLQHEAGHGAGADRTCRDSARARAVPLASKPRAFLLRSRRFAAPRAGAAPQMSGLPGRKGRSFVGSSARNLPCSALRGIDPASLSAGPDNDCLAGDHGAGSRIDAQSQSGVRTHVASGWLHRGRGAGLGRRNCLRYLAFRNSSGEMPACARMARKVPSGTSPGWFGRVVYRFVRGLNQISWEPAACRSNMKPSDFRRLAIRR